MNRAQLRAKAERRKMRQECIKGRSGWDAQMAEIRYSNWLYQKGWMYNDPKKVAKHSPWIRTTKDLVKHMNQEYAKINQGSTFWSS